MLSDFDIAMSASLTALLISMGRFAQACAVFTTALFLHYREED